MQLSPKEFEYQFRCLYRPLNMYALRYTENLDDAEDIVQQAFSDVSVSYTHLTLPTIA